MVVGASLALIAAGAAVQIAAAERQRQVAQANARAEQDVARRNAEQAALSFERDAELLGMEADRERDARSLDSESMRLLMRRRLAARETAITSAGIELEGSPLLIMAQEARELELAVRQEETASEFREMALRDEADLLEFRAEETRKAGTFAGQWARREGRLAEERARFQQLSALVGAGASALSVYSGRPSPGPGGRSLGTRTSNIERLET